MDAETVAAIIRVTGGNFRLLNRLLTQMERILEINGLVQVTKAVGRDYLTKARHARGCYWTFVQYGLGRGSHIGKNGLPARGSISEV